MIAQISNGIQTAKRISLDHPRAGDKRKPFRWELRETTSLGVRWFRTMNEVIAFMKKANPELKIMRHHEANLRKAA